MKSYMGMEDVANVNCSHVLNIIQKMGAVSRNEITEITGLSWGGMTKIVNKLLEKEYIIESKQKRESASGRTPRVLSINTDKNYVIGLDINRTGMKAIVSDLTGKVLKSFSKETIAENKEVFLKEIFDFISEIVSGYEQGIIISIGIAMQGIVDCRKGISVKFPGMTDWTDVPLKEYLEKHFHIPVSVEHDPDCLLYPHIPYQSKDNILLLRIDKSIGMAVAVDGHILKGKGLFEVAHMTVVPGGKECSCGNRGCMEAYIRSCMDKEKQQEAFEELLMPLAVTVKNMSALFHSKRVILTGILMENPAFSREALTDFLHDMNCNAEIVFTDLADYAVQGAALLAVDKSIQSFFTS